jgi:hypothetical protein
MKKLIVGLMAVVVLSGCSGEENVSVVYNELPIESYDLYDGESFRMQYPKGWKVVDGDKVAERYKSSAKLVLIDDDEDAFFTPNMVVEGFAVEAESSLGKVYESVWDGNRDDLLLIEEIGRENFTTIANGSVVNGLLVEFKGKRKLEGDVLVYLQSLVVSGSEAWLVTGAFDELDGSVEAAEMIESLKTLAIK